MSAGRLLRGTLWALLLMALALAAATLGVVVEGERALRESDRAFNQGRVEEALAHAQRAATLYAPGAPHRARAYERMVAIAVGSEKKGDTQISLRAWRAVRGAVLETRHLWVVEPALLSLANENLARLNTQTLAQEAAAVDRAQTQGEALELLSRDEAPRAVWVVILALGFAATCAGLAWAALLGVTRRGEVIWDRLRWPGGLIAAGLVCWLLAVFRA
jgi:hypothetical protein